LILRIKKIFLQELTIKLTET